MANTIKHAGQVNKAQMPDGTMVERADMLIMKLGENIVAAEVVPEQDHFLYQRIMPISNEDFINKYKGVIPYQLRGPNAMCTCGAEAVVLLEGPYVGKAICKCYAQFGRHQTSFKIIDGVMQVDKYTESNQMASSEDIINNDIRSKPNFH